MKHGHPSREWSDSKKQAHEVMRDHKGEMSRGVDHLKEHHRDEKRELNRDTKKEPR